MLLHCSFSDTEIAIAKLTGFKTPLIQWPMYTFCKYTPWITVIPSLTDPYRAGDCDIHIAAATTARTKAKNAPPGQPAAFTASPVKGITVLPPIPAVALLVPEPADAEAAAPPAVKDEDPVAVVYGKPNDEKTPVAAMMVLVALPEATVPKHVTET